MLLEDSPREGRLPSYMMSQRSLCADERRDLSLGERVEKTLDARHGGFERIRKEWSLLIQWRMIVVLHQH
jgi:hypothetical protein